MNKVITFLKNFRQTNGYKYIGYTTYIGILSITLFYAFINSKGLMSGMGGLIFFIIPLALFLFLFNVLIIVFLCIGVSQAKSPQGKTNMLHDIGVIICIICYCHFGLSVLNRQITPNFEEDEHNIGMALRVMGKDCDKKIDEFAYCFVEYLNQFKQFKTKPAVAVNKNIIVTYDNKRTYAFYIDNDCSIYDNCYVIIKDNNKTNGKYMQTFIKYNPSNLSPWGTTHSLIKK